MAEEPTLMWAKKMLEMLTELFDVMNESWKGAEELCKAMPARLLESRMAKAEINMLIAKSEVELESANTWLHTRNEMHRLDPHCVVRRNQQIFREMVAASETVVDEITALPEAWNNVALGPWTPRLKVTV